MSDENRIKLSYEELAGPQVDRVLAEARKQQKAAAVREQAGARGVRTRAFRKLFLLALTGLLGLLILLSLIHFGGPWISGKLGLGERQASEQRKPPWEQKSKRI